MLYFRLLFHPHSSWSFLFRCFSLFCLAFSLDGLADDHDTKDQAEKAYGTIGIGKGFATYNKQVLPATAIENFTVTKTAPEGTVQFTFIENATHLKRDLGIYASEEVPIRVANFKNLNNFVHGYENNDNVLSLIYKAGWLYNYTMTPSKPGESFVLSQAALTLYEKSPKTFLSTFGDSFVTEVSAGVAVYLMVQINFESAEKKTAFEEQIQGGKEHIASVTLRLKALIDQQECKGSLNIKAIQLGGSPDQLSRIFRGSTPAQLSAKNKQGIVSHGYEFKDIESFNSVIASAINYTSDLAGQLKGDSTDELFFFGNLSLAPYNGLNPNISTQTQGMLTQETLNARAKLVDSYQQLKLLRSLKIPFFTLNHFKQSLPSCIKNNLETAWKYKEDLETFFDASADSSEHLCFSSGFEETHCNLALQNLKKIVPKNFETLLPSIKQLDFSVNVGGQYALYPVALPAYDQSVVSQQFASTDVDQQRGGAEITVNYSNAGRIDKSLYNLVSEKNVRQMTYKLKEKRQPYRETHHASKTDTHEFTAQNGTLLSFNDTLSFPHDRGHVCLHLPAGAWFVGTIHNETSGKSKQASVFQRVKIKAGVGDSITIYPQLGMYAALHRFTVTVPYDTGKEDAITKLPLNTTVHFWGDARNSYYSLIYNDQTCF